MLPSSRHRSNREAAPERMAAAFQARQAEVPPQQASNRLSAASCWSSVIWVALSVASTVRVKAMAPPDRFSLATEQVKLGVLSVSGQ